MLYICQTGTVLSRHLYLYYQIKLCSAISWCQCFSQWLVDSILLTILHYKHKKTNTINTTTNTLRQRGIGFAALFAYVRVQRAVITTALAKDLDAVAVSGAKPMPARVADAHILNQHIPTTVRALDFFVRLIVFVRVCVEGSIHVFVVRVTHIRLFVWLFYGADIKVPAWQCNRAHTGFGDGHLSFCTLTQ